MWRLGTLPGCFGESSLHADFKAKIVKGVSDEICPFMEFIKTARPGRHVELFNGPCHYLKAQHAYLSRVIKGALCLLWTDREQQASLEFLVSDGMIVEVGAVALQPRWETEWARLRTLPKCASSLLNLCDVHRSGRWGHCGIPASRKEAGSDEYPSTTVDSILRISPLPPCLT